MLTNSSRVTVIGGNLLIRNVRRNDTGMYSCTVENFLRSQTSSAYLTVQVSPTIHEVLGPSRVQWKQNILFSCKLDGVPTPRVIWFKDMSKIPYTSRIYARGSELHIISSGNDDTGNYTCEASNVVGSTKMTRQLIVEVPPNEPLNLKIREITSTSLQILWHPGFNGYSPITSYKLEIRRNSTPVWSTVSERIKSENYTVDYLKPYTVYHLRVLAENKIGWSRPSERVWNRTGEDSPSSPTGLQCQTINSSTIFLTWNKPSLPNGKLRKYNIQYSNQSNHADVSTASMTRYIRGLQPFTWYTFRIQAATGGNPVLLWGNYSSYVSCRSGQAAPIDAPRNLMVQSSGPHSIWARWQKIPIGSENGIVIGYYLQYKTPWDVNYTRIFIAGNDTLQYNITGLFPWTNYTVQIAAITVALGPWTLLRASETDES
ncbi:Down syndrome cell adhesion molecule-like isoform X1, partial [Paramuricea clavata]